MTDLEITKLCAEAMGHEYIYVGPEICIRTDGERDARTKTPMYRMVYQPLYDDAQCFALVKKFQVVIEREMRNTREFAVTVFPSRGFGASVSSVRNSTDLNRAICECVAHMQKAKHA